MGNRFQDIDFGLASAENERSNSPELLISGFLDEEGYIDKILKDRYFLIHGQKGSGKSAIASRLELLSRDKDLVVKLQPMNDFNYPEFEKLLPGGSTTEMRNRDTWELLLSIPFFEMFSIDKKTKIKNSKITIEEIVKELKILKILPAENLKDILKGLKTKHYKFDAKIIQAETTIEPPKDLSIDKMRSTLINSLYNVEVTKKNLLIIDGLDSILTKGTRQYRVLSSLIHVASEMNRKFKNNNLDAKIIVLCRTDLLDKLEDPNKNKIVQDSSFELDWYQDVKDPGGTNLYKLINLRASNSLGRSVNVVDEFLPDNMHGSKSTSQYIIEQTRHTPRDMIQLMNYIKEYKGRITKDSVFNSIRSYSTKYFIEEIKDELVGFVNRSDVDSLFYVISSMGKIKFSLSELKENMAKHELKFDPLSVLNSLFECGAIANIKDNRYTFKYRNRGSGFNPYEEIYIHSALHHALRVGHVAGLG